MKQYTHEELLSILEDIDNLADEGVEVSDWEAKFIESNLDARSFTRAQKGTIIELKSRYLKGRRS